MRNENMYACMYDNYVPTYQFLFKSTTYYEVNYVRMILYWQLYGKTVETPADMLSK